MKKIYKTGLVAGVLVLGAAIVSQARETTVTATMATGYDFNEREYAEADIPEESAGVAAATGGTASEDSDSEDRRELFATPGIALLSKGERDQLTFKYAPSLRYDDQRDDTEVNHSLNAAYQRFLSRAWSLNLTNNFVLSDDPVELNRATAASPTTSSETGAAGSDQGSEVTPTSGTALSRDLGRRRFWTNTLSTRSDYAFAQDSTTGLGYAFSVLRNDSGDEEADAGYDEYDKHDFSGQYAYRFNPTWRSDLQAHYILGLYDETKLESGVEDTAAPNPPAVSNDLQEYHLMARTDYSRSEKDSHPLIYNFIGTTYDDDAQDDIWAHEATLGWEHSVDERTKVSVGAGPSYVESENLDGEWGYNAFGRVTRSYQHASIQLVLDKSYETDNFSGTEDTGFTDRYHAGLRFTYKFSQDLSASLFGDYTDDTLMDPKDEYLAAGAEQQGVAIEEQSSVGDITYDKTYYEVGASTEYTFLQWLKGSLEYSYFDQDADLVKDRYDEHRVLFTLTAMSDLWRW